MTMRADSSEAADQAASEGKRQPDPLALARNWLCPMQQPVDAMQHFGLDGDRIDPSAENRIAGGAQETEAMPFRAKPAFSNVDRFDEDMRYGRLALWALT